MNGLATFTVDDYDRCVDAHGGMSDERGLRVEAMVVEAGRRGLRHLVDGFMSGRMTAGEMETALQGEATS